MIKPLLICHRNEGVHNKLFVPVQTNKLNTALEQSRHEDALDLTVQHAHSLQQIFAVARDNHERAVDL